MLSSRGCLTERVEMSIVIFYVKWPLCSGFRNFSQVGIFELWVSKKKLYLNFSLSIFWKLNKLHYLRGIDAMHFYSNTINRLASILYSVLFADFGLMNDILFHKWFLLKLSIYFHHSCIYVYILYNVSMFQNINIAE